MSKHPNYVFILFLTLAIGYGQETKTVEIRQAASFEVNEKQYPDAKILKSNTAVRVHLHHEGMDIWSDIAYFYETENSFEAEGNVVVKQGDSLELNSEYVAYSGTTKLAIAKHKVRLKNNESILRTDSLFFNRQKQEAYYKTPGEITSEETVIRSQSGTYIVDDQKYEFISNVVVTDPSFTIHSQRMDYYTEPRHAYFYGATTINGESYDVFCKRGFFDSNLKKGYFQDRANVDYNLRNIKGDSIYFDDQVQYAAASTNVQITDTIGNNIIRGGYGEIFKDRDSAIVTQNPIAIKLVDSDSLYIHADTLLATGPPEERILTGYYGVRIFKTNLSGVSDSIHIDQKSGLIQLLRYPISDRESQLLSARDMTKRNPVLWSAKTQMSGDVIHLLTDSTSNAIDSLKIFNNAIVAEQDSLNPLQFNQMKGINLLGNFEDNELKTIDIDKNAEMLYYLYDDTTQELIGIDKAICSAIQLRMADNQIQSISFLTNPEGAVYPTEELPINEQKLPGFFWRGDERIRSQKDLVIKTIKHPKLPESERDKLQAGIQPKMK